MVSRSRLVAAGGALSLIALFGGVALAPAAQGSRAAGSVASRLGPHEAAAFAMTNRSTGNEIITYKRAANGALRRVGGSVAGNGIPGFTAGGNGRLTPLQHSFRLLSSPVAVPGTVQFSPDGGLLPDTEKTTNEVLSPDSFIDAFPVGSNGLASATPRRVASHGVRPFSLAFRKDGELLVAESIDATPGRAAVSSYWVSSNGSLAVTSGSVPNRQTDSCWIVITKDGSYAYTANFGSGTISSYSISSSGKIRVIDGKAGFLGAISQPVDLALSTDGHYLYLLLRGTGGVAAFRIQRHGGRYPLGVITGGLPAADGAPGLGVF